MLQTVDIAPRRLDDHCDSIGSDAIDELRALAAPLHGARVRQINATPYGGGVSELLRSLVPLERDLRLAADWKIISGEDQERSTRAARTASVMRNASGGFFGNLSSIWHQQEAMRALRSGLEASLPLGPTTRQ